MTTKLSIFVLMPFSEAFRDVYVLGIRAAAESLGMSVSRVDEQIFHRESILQRIYDQIESADLVIAEMTGQNPNVFYEVGYAHAKNKRCILITKSAADIPFDLKHHRHIVYDSSIFHLKEKLISDLKEIQRNTLVSYGSLSAAIPYLSGEFRRHEWYDEGKLEFRIDIHNNSESQSETIEAFYIYTRKKVNLLQDGAECPFTASDIEGYNSRYLIKTPSTSIPRNGWIQIKLAINFGMIGSYKSRKDKYEYAFRSMIRIVRKDGYFDHVISEDVEITDDIPF